MKGDAGAAEAPQPGRRAFDGVIQRRPERVWDRVDRGDKEKAEGGLIIESNRRCGLKTSSLSKNPEEGILLKNNQKRDFKYLLKFSRRPAKESFEEKTMACVTLTIRCRVSAARILQSICLVSSRSFSQGKTSLAAQNFTDYKSICDQYKPEVPEYFNFAKDVVDNWAQSEKEGRRPSSPALWWVSEQGTQVEWSFVELALESKKAATVLSEQGGLQEGDRVVVILPRIPEWWLLNLACIRTAKDLHHRLEASKAKCVITDSALAPVVDSDDQERTASTLRGDFYITGDRGFQDEDGYIWLVGRRDDVINSAGYRIGPFEVENALIEHDAVVEAAVVVKAFVVLAPEYISHDQEALIKELQDYVKTVTAPYKYPRKMEFIPHLPKTISGKIRRNELRKKEWGQATFPESWKYMLRFFLYFFKLLRETLGHFKLCPMFEPGGRMKLKMFQSSWTVPFI
ncbi:hypothetical protein E2320_012119, partial [Naja naja]